MPGHEMTTFRSLLTPIAAAALALACSGPAPTAPAPTATTVSTSPPTASPSAPGAEFAFVGDVPAFGPTIFRTDADTKDVAKLALGNGPAWSPDGSRLAFWRQVGDAQQLWVMDADGGGQVQVGEGFGPVWSPDGSSIAFSRSMVDLGDLLVMNADGSGTHPISGGGSDFAWSPDGTHLVTVIGSATPQINVVDAAGTEAARLADGTQPSYSPDGTKIVYLSWAPTPQIQVVTLATAETQTIGAGIADPWEPTWSPDGKSIAFVTRHGDLYLASLSGGDPQLLTSKRTAAGAPAFAPDGTRIALTMEGTLFGATVFDIWMVGIDGSGGRPFTETGTASLPTWRPLAP
jgi:Tol biopolymer transport system component